MEAMQAQTVGVVKRIKEITLVMKTPENILEEQGVTSAEIEDMLGELQEHVESIAMANDLDTIGGLVPLLEHLKYSSAGIRAKDAEVVMPIVQNNPKSQQLVMEANGLGPMLTNLTSDPDVTVRTKALGPISCKLIYYVCFFIHLFRFQYIDLLSIPSAVGFNRHHLREF